MSLKAIEMQIALPRTVDAGKIHEQIEQRGQALTDHANTMVQKEAELKRNSVIKNEESAKTKLKKEEQKEHHEHWDKGIEKKKTEVKKKEHHPYKGTIIDYSG